MKLLYDIETRLAGQGSIKKKKDYTFSWHGNSVDELREHGVWFAVKNTLLQSIEVESVSNEFITTLRLHLEEGTTTHVSVFWRANKNTFFEKLNVKILKLALVFRMLLTEATSYQCMMESEKQLHPLKK